MIDFDHEVCFIFVFSSSSSLDFVLLGFRHLLPHLNSNLVDPLLHEVQQLLDGVHVLAAVLLLASLDGQVDEHVQAGHGQVVQQVDGVAAERKSDGFNPPFEPDDGSYMSSDKSAHQP